MSIQQSIENVFPFQLKYSQSNTPAMQARGDLIRNDIPRQLRSAVDEGKIPNASLIKDYFIEGSDGKGNKNYVPWVRFASESLSPSARIGWYITFLFSSDGSSVWLVIAHASSSEGGKAISKEVRQKLKEWGLSKLPSPKVIDTNLSSSIDLNADGPGLGDIFESTSLFGFQFKKNEVPTDYEILSKVNVLIPHLKTLYDAELSDPTMPSAEPTEIKAAEEAGEDVAAVRAKLAAEYTYNVASPFLAAERGELDGIIEPSATRIHVIKALRALRTKRASLPPKKHGNIPL